MSMLKNSSQPAAVKAGTSRAIAAPISAYAPKLRCALTCPELPFGRTKQSFKAECDINNIMAKFVRTGVLDFVNKHEPRYGDVSGLEFQAAQLIVAQGKTMFEELPSHLRARFENDPGAFLDFVGDEKNREEARELGLLRPDSPPVTPTPTPDADGVLPDPDETSKGETMLKSSHAGPKGPAKR